MLLQSLIKPGMREVFFGRHSTDKQEMDTQRNLALEFIKKYACECVGEYLDAGVSARKKELDERDGISKLLADAHLGKYDFVVVSQHDRLARKPSEHHLIRITLKEKKIPVILASSETLYDSGDLIVDLIKDGNSKLEVENTRIRTRDTMYNLFKQGKWRGGKPPYGYRYHQEDRSIRAVPHEIQTVREIFSLYLTFMGFDSIAARLPSGTYQGNDWTDQAVRAVITKPFYAGCLTRGRKKTKANNSFNPRTDWELKPSPFIPAAVSLDEWERAWDIYESRVNGEAAPNLFKTSFLLTNLLICGDCGMAFKGKDQTTTSKKGKIYGKLVYRCSTCGYKIDLDKAHRIIDHLLKDLRFRHEETIIKKIMDSCQQELERDQEDAAALSIATSEMENKINIIESEIKQQFVEYHNMEQEDAGIAKVKIMIKVLTFSKENNLNRVNILKKQLEEKLEKLKRRQSAVITEEEISRKLKKLKVSDCRSTLLRGLLLNFVKQIVVNKNGKVQIFAHHDMLETDI